MYMTFRYKYNNADAMYTAFRYKYNNADVSANTVPTQGSGDGPVYI